MLINFNKTSNKNKHVTVLFVSSSKTNLRCSFLSFKADENDEPFEIKLIQSNVRKKYVK